jgi:hypothetical protein
MTADSRPEGKKPKGAGGKNNRAMKANKNIATSLPDRVKEGKQEKEVSRGLAEEQLQRAFTIQEQAVIDLHAEGLSFRTIGRMGKTFGERDSLGHKKRYLLPSQSSIRRWRAERPEFKEESEKALNSYIDSCAQEAMRLVRSLRKLRGVSDDVLEDADKLIAEKDAGKRDAIFKRANIYLRHAEVKVRSINSEVRNTLDIAGRRVAIWQEGNAEAGEVIVFEPYGGWVPTNLAKGGPGQGPDAEAAVERWKAMQQARQEENRDN